jgi:hypothetical protein
MIMANSLLKTSVAATATFLVAGSVLAEVVYQVPTSGTVSTYITSKEYGDEVVLGGTDRFLTSFQFQYSANYAAVGGLTFRLYDQTGPLIGSAASPGTVLFSTTLDVVSGVNTVTIPFDGSSALPNRLTYTVQFPGVGGASEAGLLAPNLVPTVGSSGNDLWLNDAGGSGWTLNLMSPDGLSPRANFVTTIEAVPEPSTIALMVAGTALVAFGFRRK